MTLEEMIVLRLLYPIPASFKVYRHGFLHGFQRETTFVTFFSQDEKALSKFGLLIKQRICSKRSKFIPFRVDFI